MSTVVIPTVRTGRRMIALVAAVILAVVVTVMAIQVANNHTSGPSTSGRVAHSAAFVCKFGRPC